MQEQVRFGMNSAGVRVMVNGKWVKGDNQVLENLSKMLVGRFPVAPEFGTPAPKRSKGAKVIKTKSKLGIFQLPSSSKKTFAKPVEPAIA